MSKNNLKRRIANLEAEEGLSDDQVEVRVVFHESMKIPGREIPPFRVPRARKVRESSTRTYREESTYNE